MEIFNNINLKALHTFGVHVVAKFYSEISDINELSQLKSLRAKYKRLLVLGGGSNILFTQDYDGLIVHNRLKGIHIIQEDERDVILKIASGENWHNLVLYTVENNWGGIENLSLIPGSVGAAPIQNIGAYGVEIKDVIQSVEVFDIHKQELKSINRNDCEFGYRNSIFKLPENKEKYFITSITIKLKKDPENFNLDYGDIKSTLKKMKIDAPNIKDVSDAVIKIRNSKLPNPKEIGNAGSFFQNPEVSRDIAEQLLYKYPTMPHYLLSNGQIKIPAAWLIEQCGWKGLRVGNTGNHVAQALVIVNYGQAKGNEIKDHALNVQQSIKEKFNILLQPEINII